MSNISALFKLLTKYNKKYLGVLFIDIFLNSLIPFPGILLSKVIFDMLQLGNSYDDYLKVIFLLVLTDMVIKYIYNYIDTIVEVKGQQFMFQLNCLFNQKTLSIKYEKLLQPSFLEKRELAFKAISGSNFIDLIRSFKNIISNIIILLGVFLIVLQVGIYIVFPVILVIIINSFINSITKRVEYDYSVQVIPYNRKIGYLQQVCSDFSYVKEVKINNCKDVIDKKYKSLVEISFNFIKKIIVQQKRGMQFGGITNAIQDIIIYSILGYKLLILRAITIGDFSMFFNSINQFKASILEIMTSLIDLRINNLSLGNFISYLNEDESMSGIVKIEDINTSNILIQFENVYFQYPGSEDYVLKNINCTLKGTQKILIVGENGAGKTTFIHLLLRLYQPTKGRILLNGIDINDINYNEYIKLFSTVFQDYKIFAFSLRENIALSNELREQKLADIIEQVGLNEKISTLPKKMETIVSKLYDEEGTEFSGGQRQKIAIARALYKESKIILLDEPTSALDPLAEYELYCQFNKMTQDRMSFFISHRLASSKFCNRILVFQQGEIIEDGTHKELIGNNALYAEMYRRQSDYYLEEA